MTVKELRTITGLSQRAFGKKYHIPTRTIEDWEGGRRKPSETILYLLERAVMEDYGMTKTFWSVEYSIWGSDSTSNAWFDNFEDAKEFSSHDYRDDPIRHTYRTEASIEDAERRVRETKEDSEW